MNSDDSDCSGSAAAEAEIQDDNIYHLSTSQACAACKFQRRRCSADCPLAPYFPSNRLREFQNVRRLFGVKNVLKTLGDLEPSKRSYAAECMIFEANCRANDLAGGCYKIIAQLQSEITFLESQRRLIFRQLQFYRQMAAPTMDLTVSRGGGGVDFDRNKQGFPSLLLDCDESTIANLGNIKEFSSLIKEEKEFDFNLEVNH